MIFLIVSLFLLFLFAVQTTFLKALAIAGITPDLILILALYCGINLKENRGIGMGFTLGLIQDCLSGGLLGVNSFAKGLVGFIFSTLKDKIIVEGLIPISFFLVVASFFDGVIYYLVTSTLLKGEWAGGVLPFLPLYAAYNALAGLVLFFFLDWGRRWIHRKFPNDIFRV